VDESHRDVEAAALASRQGRHRGVGHRLQTERGDQLVGAAPRIGPPQAVAAALADQLVPAALAVPCSVALPDVADAAPDGPLRRRDVVPGHERGAGRRRHERREQPQRGGLPAPFGPSRATSSPRSTSRSRPRTASTVFFFVVKCFVNPLVRIIVVFMHTTLGTITVTS